eukprot:344474_1
MAAAKFRYLSPENAGLLFASIIEWFDCDIKASITAQLSAISPLVSASAFQKSNAFSVSHNVFIALAGKPGAIKSPVFKSALQYRLADLGEYIAKKLITYMG